VGRVVSAGQPIRAREYDAFRRAVAANGCSHVVARQGMILEGGQGSRWYVMAPGAGFVDADTSHATPNLNNSSVVIKLQYGNVSFLLTGDAEEDVEEDLLARYGDFLRSSLLKAGHHGSITSSSAPFVAAVRPAWVAISVGLHNKFHHPSGVVIRRYDEEGASVARTDREGALMFETDGTTLTQVHWR
jgi:competence protein ComEC